MASRSRVVKHLAEGTSRFAIFDLESGKPYVMAIYANEASAQLDLRDLLKPYPPDHVWRRKLCVKSTSGCRDSGPKGAVCNLAEGHTGPHGEVVWFTETGGRTNTVWMRKSHELSERTEGADSEGAR